MDWKPDKDRPICPQIYEYICVKIASGNYASGEKLPSVRDFAVFAGVNPNTVQRSFEMLEKDGIIFTERNSGRFVSENIALAENTVHELRRKKTEEYIEAMHSLGLDGDAVKKYIEEMII